MIISDFDDELIGASAAAPPQPKQVNDISEAQINEEDVLKKYGI